MCLLYAATGDRDRFLEAETAARRQAGLPPFGRLAASIVSTAEAETCDFTTRGLSRAAPQLPGITVLGPALAPLAILRGRHRRRFLVKAGREMHLQAVVRDWLSRVRTGGSARIQVDIDPYCFLWRAISREPGKQTGKHSIPPSEPSIPSSISSSYQSLAPQFP